MSLIKGTPAKYIGRVYAADEETAIKRAIVEHRVPEQYRFKLAAQRED